MNLEEIREFCLNLPGATEDVKWGNDLCFCIAEKMFCVCSLGDLFSVTVKVESEQFEEYIATAGIIPAPYLARSKWITIQEQHRFSENDWKNLIVASYNLIVSKLPKRVREEIGNDNSKG